MFEEVGDVDFSGCLWVEYRDGCCCGCRCAFEACGENDRDLFREVESCPPTADLGLYALLVIASSC